MTRVLRPGDHGALVLATRESLARAMGDDFAAHYAHLYRPPVFVPLPPDVPAFVDWFRDAPPIRV